MSANLHDTAVTSLGFRPALEGLRGLAVLLVVLFHAQWLSGGFLGVDLFLVLSGFLITTLLLEEWRARRDISLTDFFMRRGLRLYPALALFLLCYAVAASVLRFGDTGRNLRSAALAAAYLANFPLAFGGPSSFPSELTHLWSLAAEAQFYLVWPPLLLLLLRRGKSAKSVALLCVLMAVAVAVWRAFVAAGGAPYWRVYYGPDMRLDTILIGCALGAWFVHRGGRAFTVRGGGWTFVAILVATAIFVERLPSGTLAMGGFLVIALVSAALVAAATATGRGSLNRLLATKPLREGGKVSYSWYLWHVLWLSLVAFTIGENLPLKIGAVVASFVTAEISYLLIERRFLKLKTRFTHRALES